MPAQPFPAQFKRETHTINGVKTVVLTAGKGEPLVFLHGAGIWHGINFALPWTEKFRVIVPFHPGFGESGDDPAMNDLHDYVMHYLDLFDALGIAKTRLVGFSLGGWLAAKFAVAHGDRVERLVLVGPAGLRGKEQPKGDVLSLPPEQDSFAAGFQFRRHQAIPAGKSQRPRFHGRALPRRRNAGAAVVGASLRHQAAALPASPHHADAAGLGRRGQALAGADRPNCGAATFPKRNSRPSRAPAIWCSTRNARRWTRCSASCRSRLEVWRIPSRWHFCHWAGILSGRGRSPGFVR